MSAPAITPTPNPESRDALSVFEQVFKHLKGVCIGQEESLRRLALVGTAHLLAPEGTPGAIRLVIGPTASGKSTLLRAFAEALSLPAITISIPRLTASGWDGTDVEDLIVTGLSSVAPGSRPWRRPVLILDDAQHVRIKSRSDTPDLLHQMNRQASLLDLLSGTGAIPLKRSYALSIDKSRWSPSESLRIVAGAFDLTLEQAASPEALEAYGFIPELANRLAQPAIHLSPLDPDDVAFLLYAHSDGMIQEVFRQLGGEYLSIDAAAAKLLAKKVAQRPGATPRTALLALEAIWEAKVLDALSSGKLSMDRPPLKLRVTRKVLARVA